MPDSNELDDILNEIKNMGNKSDKESEAPQHRLTRDEAQRAVDEFSTPAPRHSNPPSDNHKSKKKSQKEPSMKNNKKIIIIAVAVIAIVAIIVGITAAVKANSKKPAATEPQTTQSQSTSESTTKTPVSTANPLTGDPDFNSKAVGKRPVACVVENSASARPQWGINDEKNPPDIIVEGEVEGGETRMLWMYADYTSVPSQIGPMRSARPPYIKFSELFDAIFLHWGQSQTKKGTPYIGANTVFRVDKVDHINQMTYSGSVALFGRDGSRGVSTEHTGVLYGDKIAAAIKEEGFRTKAKQKNYTKFGFNKEEKALSDTVCDSLALTFSSRTATRDWSYSSSDKMYHCNDYGTDVARKNLLVLFDETEYIAKANYKNSGSAEIYCNYTLAGGKGKLASNGTVIDIKWSVDNGVIVLKTTDDKDVKLNIGTTWIGYASSNNGGAATAK